MKSLLIFPPDWLPSEPYLSLPSLASVLRPAGHDVTQLDVNVEMYDMFFSTQFLQHTAQRIATERNYLQDVEKERGLDEEEQALLERLLTCTPELFQQFSEDVERAKKILRGETFYDIDQLEWATNCLHQTMALISLAYYPAQICFPPIETDIVYKPFMSTEILEAVDDDQINIYRDVYRMLIRPIMERDRPVMIGISVVQQKQLIATFTFCKMIKEEFPATHITLGGNIITRIRDTLPEMAGLWEWFDSAVVYEGESAYLKLTEAVKTGGDFSKLPNLIYKDETGVHTNKEVCSENLAELPPPDFDGLPLEKYFVPHLILPYLATRGCYWGRCTFCDHFQGYVEGFRTKQVDQIMEEIKFLKEKYETRFFHFTDESYPPALFQKLSRKLIDDKTDIAWTTHMRFEESLLEEKVWQDVAESGCKYLHFGYESGNQRVLKLMDKATKLDAIETNLRMSSEAGIWNHLMGFFGFPGETSAEADDSKAFVEKNSAHIHSLGFMTFVLGKYSPIAFEPEKYGVSYYKNPEWDLALDYYFTTKDGLSIQQAIDVFDEFERKHNTKWDLRTCVREYIFLYIDKYGSNHLPQLEVTEEQRQQMQQTTIGMV
ncbi:MAG: radical SAM protein [Nitrospina sp.]|mgnify:FL=1|jgi:anaerobic magnesium-protoporphyrin IX monomethyl ester cyclase|nr:radical SAM protein [Nitrospina sp.]MBT4105896.1 radical SAM protein [Nitrospina sp.]MBT4390187.1 radical SAM protein [Nitrospina sp.]MBT4620604.1 radical SAM protein [Nitrospina sp.]MBT4898227.1 radical SAM protein [Nitrospina sp.]